MELIAHMLANYTTLVAGAAAILTGLYLVFEGKPIEGGASIMAGVGLIREAMRPD